MCFGFELGSKLEIYGRGVVFSKGSWRVRRRVFLELSRGWSVRGWVVGRGWWVG